MTRSKKFNKLLKKLNGKEGSVFDTDRNLIGRGNLSYEVGKEGNSGLYLNNKRIPLSSIRNIDPNFNENALVFVDSAYKLAERFK